MKVKKFSKRAFAVFLTVLLVLSAVPLCAGATEDTSDFGYNVSNDDTAIISAYYGSDSSLVIPTEIDGYKVTGIDWYAFSGCTSLISVIIPDSVTSIGGYAFYDCTSLENIKVESNNADYSSENGVLFNKEKTELIQYPVGKTLTDYSIPESVTNIDNEAFRGCTSLTSVTIPKSVTSIGDYTFYGCTSLESINVGNNNANYSSENSILFNKDKTELIQYPARKTLTVYSIPESVTSIGRYAFSYCTSLTSITIPESVTSIGDYAFAGCTSLISITIPDSVKSIGSSVFDGCTSLASVTIPDSVTSISSYAFYGCTSLTSVIIPNSVTSVENNAFSGCTSLTSVTIPDSVTSIYGGAFEGCTGLTSITLPESVTRIWGWVFANCISLTSITIPDSVISIYHSAFKGCASLASVTISDNVTFIDDDAFYGCTNLTSITIPNSVTEIGYHALGYIDSENKVNGFTIYGTAGTEAENYATENGFTFIALDNENYIHNDSNSGISVIAKADADLTVSEITDEQSISEANLMLAQGESVKNLYDISLTKDGEKVQHEGMAEVKIPCDNENAKVYRVESDNTLTDMNAVYTDGNLVFHTEHFSLYIVAEEKKETETVGDMNRDGKLDVTDVTAIQIELANTGTDYYDTVADTDKDGKVDVADVTYLQQFIADTIIKF